MITDYGKNYKMTKKEERIAIFNKYNGHCAYCGKQIIYKDMQVDHIFPKISGGGNDFDNLNPSCRRCNHYKRSEELDVFRKMLQTIQERLMKIYIFKVAVDYGVVKIEPFDGKFYYEKLNEH